MDSDQAIHNIIEQAANLVYNAGQLASPPSYPELAAQVRALADAPKESIIAISAAEAERQEKLQQASLARIVQLEAAMVAAGVAVPPPEAT
jgi:hypothetical protein